MLSIHDTRTEFNAQSCTTAVLPVGAVEQHGKHLPFSTDILLAEAIARAVAGALDAYLLPPVAISASIEHREAKGTVYLRAETLAQVVRDIAESLRHSGFRRLVLVNFHGGNWILKPTIRELNRDRRDFRVVLINPELPVPEAAAIFSHPAGDIHAGEFETSLMLHLHPDKVRRVAPAGARSFPPQPMLDYFDATQLTADGSWGWPEAATAEKGRRAFDALVAAALRFLRQIDELESAIAGGADDGVAIRPMRADDVAVAHELRRIAGWNQTEEDWRGYLAFEPDGCFVAEVAGRPAGTVTTIRYGDRVGWVGMVLVHPDQRRRGVGTRMLTHAIAWLRQRGVHCIKLDATPLGKKVYAPLGFVAEYDLARYDGTAPLVAGVTSPRIGALAAAELAEIVRLDAQAFGCERAPVLRSLAGRNPELCFAARENGAVSGFLIARQGASAVQVGPWIARDAATAEDLLHAFFRSVAGRRVFIDAVEPNAAATALLGRHGLAVQRTLTRMFLGENADPGEPRLVYGISSPEKG